MNGHWCYGNCLFFFPKKEERGRDEGGGCKTFPMNAKIIDSEGRICKRLSIDQSKSSQKGELSSESQQLNETTQPNNTIPDRSLCTTQRNMVNAVSLKVNGRGDRRQKKGQESRAVEGVDQR